MRKYGTYVADNALENISMKYFYIYLLSILEIDHFNGLVFFLPLVKRQGGAHSTHTRVVVGDVVLHTTLNNF